MRLLTLFLVVVACNGYSWIGAHKAPIQRIKKAVASGVVASSLGLGLGSLAPVQVQVARADEASTVMVDTLDAPAQTNKPKPIGVQTVDISSSSEEDRVQRKLAMQKSAKEPGEGKYADSLKKEQAKQKDRKKSKTARSQDLCEVLGRGC
jgi:hypothetical protein